MHLHLFLIQVYCVNNNSNSKAETMTTPEAKVKNAVVKILKRHNIYYFFPATHGYGRSGVPDIIACHDGTFFGIECKAGDNQPTELQKRELQRIQAAGGRTMVVRESNLDHLEKFLDFIEDSDGRC
jgi:hypothetical protein